MRPSHLWAVGRETHAQRLNPMFPQYLVIMLVTGGWLTRWPAAIGLGMWPILVIACVRLAGRGDAYLASRFGSEFPDVILCAGFEFPMRPVRG